MTRARDHTPQITVAEINALGSLFSIDSARQVCDRVGAGLPPRLDADEYREDVEAEPEDMVVAQLAVEMNDAAVRYGFDLRDQTSASAAMHVRLARRISERCERLLEDMLDENGNLLPSLGSGGLWALAALQGGNGAAQVSRAMTGVRDLQRWSTGMANRFEAVEAPREEITVGSPDHAFHNLMNSLGGIFVQFWRRAPGVSRPDQTTPDGPFFRFVAAVADELKLDKTDEALATAIKRNGDLRAMRELLSGRWTGGE